MGFFSSFASEFKKGFDEAYNEKETLTKTPTKKFDTEEFEPLVFDEHEGKGVVLASSFELSEHLLYIHDELSSDLSLTYMRKHSELDPNGRNGNFMLEYDDSAILMDPNSEPITHFVVAYSKLMGGGISGSLGSYYLAGMEYRKKILSRINPKGSHGLTDTQKVELAMLANPLFKLLSRTIRKKLSVPFHSIEEFNPDGDDNRLVKYIEKRLS